MVQAKSRHSGNLKKVTDDQHVYNEIGTYFNDTVLTQPGSGVNFEEMMEALQTLIKESDLSDQKKQDLHNLHDAGDYGSFLSRAFIYAILGDNQKKDTSNTSSEVNQTTASDINHEIAAFKRLLKEFKKPNPLSPPSTIATEEMKYVTELFRVYQEKTGAECNSVEDLDSYPKMKKNFARQRKDYYLAETIRRGLRDTVASEEDESFDNVKDEMYEGVVTTEEKDYDCGYDRMSAVMEHATLVELSSNLKTLTLNWIGPGEKKGICHMLVNDDRLNWIEGD